MNSRYVIRQFGLLFCILSLMLLTVALWSGVRVLHGDGAERPPLMAFLTSSAAGLLIGGAMWVLPRPRGLQLGRREAMLLVALSWIGGAALAGLPYFVWAHLDDGIVGFHAFHSPVNCYFEAMSGLTTTGATILAHIDAIPRGILLWRAMTQWLGGLGIVVLFVAVLPGIGVGGRKLFRVEAPGPEREGVHPHIRDTARILWLIYLGLTVAQSVALRLAGMTWFDAVCYTFATSATGGFSTTDASIGAYHASPAVDWIVIVFMVLAGMNFGLYYQFIRGRLRLVWQDAELRLYLAVLLIGSVIVVVSIRSQPIVMTTGDIYGPSIGEAIRQGVFTTVSQQTTSGFCAADFDRWPFLAKATLIVVMFVGGSAGSTSGGIKVIRVLITFKVLFAELEKEFRPNVVRPIKIGSVTIPQELRLATVAYVLGFLLLFGAGAGLLMVTEPAGAIDITTAATASVATLCNIGPGLAKVGAVCNYAWFTAPSKVVMSILMALGRLELFAILSLFVPRFWRRA